MTSTVLILGACGKIGSHFARAFRAEGWNVRLYDRKAGDMIAAARGADVIVNGLNPPAYHDWKTLIPRITDQVLSAAKASGATVIVPGNVYVYGDQSAPWTEATPHRPVSRKGTIRATMEARYRAAAAEGVRTIVLRAGDFIDPDGNGDTLQLLFLRNLARGQITSPGNPDVTRAYAYLPDLARAAVALATIRDQLDPFEDVSFPGFAFSTRELAAEVSAQTGRALKIGRFPWWAMRLAAPVWELARELLEMRYLYETPHRIESAKFARLLPGFRATSFAEAIASAPSLDVSPDKVMGQPRVA